MQNARYTDEDYWHAGLELFTLGLSVSEDPKDTELLQSYIDRCNEHFDDAKPHVQSVCFIMTLTSGILPVSVRNISTCCLRVPPKMVGCVVGDPSVR